MEATLILNRKTIVAPKLRFKEFRNDWNQEKLANFIEFISGFAFDSSQMSLVQDKYQLIKMSNVYKSELQLERSPSYWGNIDKKTEKYLLQKQDILLTLTGTVGKRDYGYSVIIPESNKFLLNQRLVCLRSIPNKSDANFINNLVKTSRFFYFFFSESKGGTGNQSNVGIDDLKNIQLNIPSLPEQHKIASFLSAVDKKIQLLTRKKELLEQYKKGVMQQLFSGKLRFKDEKGKDYPVWEEKRLGDVISIFNGYAFSSSDARDSGCKWVKIADVGINEMKQETPSFLPDDFKRKYSKFLLRTGDYVIALTRPILNGKLKIARIDDQYDNSMLNQRVGKLTTNHYLTYTYYLMQRKELVSKIENRIAGTDPPNLSPLEINAIKITIPLNIEEQKKIAEFLSALDKKIKTTDNQIIETQTFKKGLLQQMFV